MSAFDDLIAKLTEKNLDDLEVDRIVNAGIGIARDLGGGEDVVARLEELKKWAEDKKQNKYIRFVDDIDELKNNVDRYNVRSEKGYPNCNAQIDLSENLSRLADDANGKDVYKIAENIMKDSYILDKGTETQRDAFAFNMQQSYRKAIGNTEFTPKEALNILDRADDLAFATSFPDCFFADVATCLDDKKVAERFCEYTEKMLDKMEEKGMSTHSIELIDVYSMIVENHPEMAEKCNNLVKKTVDMAEGDDKEMLEKAVEYDDKVNNTDGVKESDKMLARIKKNSYKKQLEKMGEKENDDAGYQYEMAWHSHTTGGMDM